MSKESTDQTEQTAAEWLIRRHSGSWAQSDQTQLDRWLGASSLNLVAYLRLELGWEEAGRLKAIVSPTQPDSPPLASQLTLTPFFDPGSTTSQETSQSAIAPAKHPERGSPEFPASAAQVAAPNTIAVAPGRRRAGLLAAAASLLLTAFAGIYVYVANPFTGDRYSTAVGRIVSVPIGDGSRVTLNTDSRIRVTLAPQERRVDLNRGEAFFDVAKDSARPFVVIVGSKRVIAVGTQFSVRRDGGEIQVAVTEGKVRIEDNASDTTSQAFGGVGEVFLTPGNIAQVSDEGVMVQRKELPEIEAQLSWRSGVLTFRKKTLADAAAEFNRYNRQKIVIADPTIASLPIEGNFRAANVEAFAHLLENGYPVAVSEESDRIVLRAR